ncbi:hypothetical protein ACO0LG_02905 [Undibacterium sp. Ji42W]|uniref:hypothetical protein n=1 Tax=Undibacterium sp. Ji42W TaxID=3413039 RepID=UPI003BF36AF1
MKKIYKEAILTEIADLQHFSSAGATQRMGVIGFTRGMPGCKVAMTDNAEKRSFAAIHYFVVVSLPVQQVIATGVSDNTMSATTGPAKFQPFTDLTTSAFTLVLVTPPHAANITVKTGRQTGCRFQAICK